MARVAVARYGDVAVARAECWSFLIFLSSPSLSFHLRQERSTIEQVRLQTRPGATAGILGTMFVYVFGKYEGIPLDLCYRYDEVPSET